MIRALGCALACAFAGGALAQTSVYSPRPDSISLTIYRDDIALVTETREVELPAEPATLVLQGVVDSIVPQSAVMNGAERPLAETNFTFDALTPASLLERSVGEVVTLVRTNPRTGRVSQREATVVSVKDGVVLRTVDGGEAFQCSGLPERMEFSRIPSGLTTTPTLSVQLAGGAAGKRKVTVSYLAYGFKWSADYVARLNEKADRMDLVGWVTLENQTTSAFREAQVQVVAGRLNLVDPEQGGSGTPGDDYFDPDETDEETGLPVTRYDMLRARDEEAALDRLQLLQGCYALGSSTAGLAPDPNRYPRGGVDNWSERNSEARNDESSEVMVTGSRVMQREKLGDYQLYRVPWPTDLSARQTKQLAFLHKPKVKIERFYSVRVDRFDSEEIEPEDTARVMLRWENTKSAGLGEPLPRGRVRVFEPYAGSDVFAGEADIQDKPTDLPVEIAIGRALNLTVEYTLEEREVEEEDERRDEDDEDEDDSGDYEKDEGRKVFVEATHRFVNNKEVPVSIEVRHAGDNSHSTPVVVKSNIRSGRKFGEIAWRFRVAPGALRELRYRLRANELY